MVQELKCYEESLISGCNRENLSLGCYETMKDHLESIKLILDYLLRNYLTYVEKELWKLLNLKLRINMLYVIAALHDLGKSLPHYQVRLKERCTAPYHELASVALLRLLDLNDLVINNGCLDTLYSLASLTILMHHHAMRPLNYLISNVGNYLREALPDNLNYEIIVDSVTKYLNICREVFGITLRISNKYINVRDLKKEIICFLNGLRKGYRGSKPKLNYVYKLSVIMVKPLLIADVIAASINRSCLKLSRDLVGNVDELINLIKPSFTKEVINWFKINELFRSEIRGVMGW